LHMVRIKGGKKRGKREGKIRKKKLTRLVLKKHNQYPKGDKSYWAPKECSLTRKKGKKGEPRRVLKYKSDQSRWDVFQV